MNNCININKDEQKKYKKYNFKKYITFYVT